MHIQISSEAPKIIVVGSASLDLILHTDKLPEPSETVMATSSESFFGGKGANQAVATARLGASVYLISCVGMDPLGQQIMRNLVSENVNVGFIAECEHQSTGTAYVTVTDRESSVVVVPAANLSLKTSHIDEASKYFQSVDMVLLQLEIPMEVVEYTVRKAKSFGKPVGIYASPGRALREEIIEQVDFIVAKSTELEIIFGEDQRDVVLKKYVNRVFIRDETNSTIYFDGTEMRYYRDENSAMMYKMGMGDAFTAGFAVARCHGNAIPDCVKFGNAVSSYVSLGKGGQTALPMLSDVV